VIAPSWRSARWVHPDKAVLTEPSGRCDHGVVWPEYIPRQLAEGAPRQAVLSSRAPGVIVLDPRANLSSQGASFNITGPVLCLSVTGADHGPGTDGSPTVANISAQDQTFGVVRIQLVDNEGHGSDIIGRPPVRWTRFL
jgi:hypothetical protein